MTATDLTGFTADANALAAAMDANAKDAQAEFAQFTDDAWLADPTNGDFYVGPKSELVFRWASWMDGWPEYNSRTTKTFVSADAAAIELDARGLGEFTPAGGVLHELRIVRFTDEGSVSMFELWYDSRQMGDPGMVCPPAYDCPGEASAIADAYLSAWSSVDPQGIASLYRSDATVIDSALGVVATGPSAIADLAGDAGRPTACAAGDLYLETNDGDPATSDNTDPLGGRILGIAIVQRCQTDAGKVDKVSVLLFGTRQKYSFDLDPDQKIVSEETFYDAADLVAAGIVR